jgi:hypothetical protein
MHEAEQQRLREIASSLVVTLSDSFASVVSVLLLDVLKQSGFGGQNCKSMKSKAKSKGWSSIQRCFASPLTERIKQKMAQTLLQS